MFTFNSKHLQLFQKLYRASDEVAQVLALGPKLATANEQMERGEYFDASKTYRKIYNKLTKREERPLRGEIGTSCRYKHKEVPVFHFKMVFNNTC